MQKRLDGVNHRIQLIRLRAPRPVRRGASSIDKSVKGGFVVETDLPVGAEAVQLLLNGDRRVDAEKLRSAVERRPRANGR